MVSLRAGRGDGDVVAVPTPGHQQEEVDGGTGHALGGVVLAESGQFLTADEFLEIEKDLSDSAGAYKTLRAFKLQNGDEPDFTFSSSTKRW